MILNVIDGNGQPQIIAVQSRQAATDRSGVIASTGDPQVLMVANANRAGFLVQNNGANPMRISEVGDADLDSAFVIAAGGYFPPAGFPVPVTALSITGTALDKFTAREW